MNVFSPGPGVINAHIESAEGELLVGLVGQVRALLKERCSEVGVSTVAEPDSSDDDAALLATLERALTPVPAPQDEVLARLFPDSRRDADVDGAADADAGEFRRLTEEDLRSGKLQDADRAIEIFSQPHTDQQLDLDSAQQVLRALNDVRLSLGTRLEVTEETDFPDEIATQTDHALMIYFWTGQIQEQLVASIVAVDSEV